MSDTNPRPSYFSQIRIDPNNDLRIWMGGVNMYFPRTAARPSSQTVSRKFIAIFTPSGSIPRIPTNMIVGNDGGICVTSDGGRTWRHLNNIAIGAVLRSGLRFPEAVSRLRRLAGQLFLVRAERDHADAAASPMTTGSPFRAATDFITASIRPSPTLSTPNRRTATCAAAICAPANRTSSARRRTTTRRRAIASSGIRR